MKHSFILKIDEISIDEISVLINILLGNRIKFHVLKSDNKVIKNKYEEAIDKAISLLEDDNVCADIRRFEPKENEEEYGVEQELLDILKGVK